MSTAQHIETLRRCPLLRALSAESLQRLLADCTTRPVRKGHVLFLAGQPAEKFYVILEGQVKIYALSPRGDEQTLHLYGPGESFAAAAMFAGGDYPAAAETVRDSSLLAVSRRALSKLLADDPDLAMGMMAGLSQKLREFARLIETLSLQDVPARLADVLLDEARRARTNPFRLSETKRQIASRIATTPETLSRVLGKLSAGGLIEVQGPQIRILDADALGELASGGT